MPSPGSPDPHPLPQGGTPHYLGHRRRLRERFLKNPQMVEDYELLELLLYWIFPRKDVKPLAKNLLKGMGSLTAVLGSSPAQLQTQGAHAAFFTFQCVREVGRRLLASDLQTAPLLNNASQVVAYCRLTMAHLPQEHFRLFFLDRKHYLIQEETHQTGTLDQIALYPREIMKRALDLNAAGLILAHNHPSGDPHPSSADVQLTQYLQTSLKPFGIQVLDHFIVGRYGYYSFREKALLP